ncbi:short-chain dehydrogenase/reductase-like protein SDR [Dendryphion nanum]|uniref:Short-chain dehydrogenase/reductase-like protein SDR n=1 Tax=Dendryphion nanum TaxID=256645 RepID=A0A9P9DDL3_9PLEO|nr:short-chain dehydrogenase/reductase-like protein SDR [Dendryphion nanum]
MANEFEGKVILITGAGSGIGRATAIKLASLGASLSLCDIDYDNLSATRKACGSSTRTYLDDVDVSSTQEVTKYIDATVKSLGKLDHVFNCAGINPTAILLEDTTDEYWDKLVNTNLKGVFNVTRACIPHLSRGSTIVNVSSNLGLRGSAQMSVYCTTKYGLIGFSKSMALELGPKGIRVNCVAPGFIDTPTNAGVVEGKKSVEKMEKGNALERLGTPDEVADVVVFLMGEGSRYMNGAVVEVDGAMRGPM